MLLLFSFKLFNPLQLETMSSGNVSFTQRTGEESLQRLTVGRLCSSAVVVFLCKVSKPHFPSLHVDTGRFIARIRGTCHIVRTQTFYFQQTSQQGDRFELIDWFPFQFCRLVYVFMEYRSVRVCPFVRVARKLYSFIGVFTGSWNLSWQRLNAVLNSCRNFAAMQKWVTH